MSAENANLSSVALGCWRLYVPYVKCPGARACDNDDYRRLENGRYKIYQILRLAFSGIRG